MNHAPLAPRPTTRSAPHRRARTASRLVAAGGLVLVLAGCATSPIAQDGAGSDASGAPTSTSSAAPDGGQGATPVADAPRAPGGSGGAGGSGGSGGASSPASSATPAAVRTCAPEAVDVVLSSTDSGAGSIDYTVLLTNEGRRPCTISGAPNARMLSETDEQLGAAATGSGASGPMVRLEPGAGAATVVRVVHVGEDGGPLAGRCSPQRAVALAIDSDVYGRYDRLDGEFRGCAEPGLAYMTVSPYRAVTA